MTKTALTAVAVTASLLGGMGVAEAAPVHGSAILTADLDVGTPDEVTPDAPVLAPDGTWIVNGSTGKATAAVVRAAAMPNTVEVDVYGARIRATVPSGRVVGLAYRGDTGGASCQIPNSGYNWGWVSINGHTGWMRTDLFTIIYQSTGPWGALPWC